MMIHTGSDVMARTHAVDMREYSRAEAEEGRGYQHKGADAFPLSEEEAQQL